MRVLIAAAAIVSGVWGPGGVSTVAARQESRPTREPPARRIRPDRVNWWNDRVFYEIFVRSFADSKEGPLAGDGIGDLPGLIGRLDYLNDGKPETTTDLGIGGIWLMPIHPSPSYHGYDVSDYYEINPQYGTIADFKRLMAECHVRGIKVIIDLVMNHCSNQNPWFKGAADPSSPHRNMFIWSGSDPGWRGPWNQRVWHLLPPSGPTAADRYYYGLFSSTMPDFNFRSVPATEAMKAVTMAWLSSYGVDGYRLDAIRHLIEEGQVQENTAATHAWLRDWFMEFKGVNMDALSIGEVWADSEQASSYVGDRMDMVFEFALADAMIASVKAGNKEAFSGAQKKVLDLYPPNQYGRFLSNHDQTRVMTQLKGDAGAMRAAAVLLLTGPGVPFVYYGEEIGMTGDKPDEMLRTPMQWTAGEHAGFTMGTPWAKINAGSEACNVETEGADSASLLTFYRKLIHLRNGNPALATGGTSMAQTDTPGVIAYLRHRVTRFMPDGGPQARGAEARPRTDTVLVVVNLSREAADGCGLSLESSPLRGEMVARDVLNDASGPDLTADERGGFAGYRPGAIPGHAAKILVLSPK